MTAPFTKWAGGKRAILPELRSMVPKTYGRYFEPFVGGGALFFDLQPERAVLSDVNEVLIAAYKGVAYHVDDVIAKLRRWEADYRNSPEGIFYAKRKLHATAEIAAFADRDHAAVAAWAIFMNRTCFNGLWRVGKRTGSFNVPWGKRPDAMICDEVRLRECSAALRSRSKVSLYAKDFADVVDHAQARDFVYFDSPYVPLSDSSDFTSYAKGGFSDADQVRLRDFAVALSERGVFVLLSNSSAPRVWELYHDEQFEIFEVPVRRAVAADGTKRAPVKELLIKSRTKGW